MEVIPSPVVVTVGIVPTTEVLGLVEKSALTVITVQQGCVCPAQYDILLSSTSLFFLNATKGKPMVSCGGSYQILNITY